MATNDKDSTQAIRNMFIKIPIRKINIKNIEKLPLHITGSCELMTVYMTTQEKDLTHWGRGKMAATSQTMF